VATGSATETDRESLRYPTWARERPFVGAPFSSEDVRGAATAATSLCQRNAVVTSLRERATRLPA